MGSTTQETERTVGAQSPEAARMQRLLASTATHAGDQMGDLSQEAGGNFQLTPEMQQQITRLQQITGEEGRIQMDENMEAITRQLEGTAIGQTMTGGSFEAIQLALSGQQQQRDMNRQGLASERQGVEIGMNAPLQYGQMKIAANKELLNRLVGGAGAVSNYDQAMRVAGTDEITTTRQPIGQQIFQGAAQVGSMLTPMGQAGVGVQGDPYGTGQQGPMQ